MLQRVLALLLLWGLCFLSWPGPAWAQQPVPPGTAPTAATKWPQLTRGQEFVNQGNTYALLPEVRAAAPGKALAPAEASRALGIEPSELVEVKGPFVIYRAAAGAKSPAVQGLAVSGRQVVINQRTGQLGVVLGSVVAHLPDISQAEAVAVAHGLRVTRAFPRLGYAYFEAAPGGDLIAALAALNSDSRVESAYLDILEHVKVPR